MKHRIYVSKKRDIDSDRVWDMKGGAIRGIRDSRSGTLIFVDHTPGAPWPHTCTYIFVNDYAGMGRVFTDEPTSGWPPDAKIEFDDPKGHLASARRKAERDLVKIRVCDKKHVGPFRATGWTHSIGPSAHTCSDFGGCRQCEPLIVEIKICDACGQEVWS